MIKVTFKLCSGVKKPAKISKISQQTSKHIQLNRCTTLESALALNIEKKINDSKSSFIIVLCWEPNYWTPLYFMQSHLISVPSYLVLSNGIFITGKITEKLPQSYRLLRVSASDLIASMFYFIYLQLLFCATNTMFI